MGRETLVYDIATIIWSFRRKERLPQNTKVSTVEVGSWASDCIWPVATWKYKVLVKTTSQKTQFRTGKLIQEHKDHPNVFSAWNIRSICSSWSHPAFFFLKGQKLQKRLRTQSQANYRSDPELAQWEVSQELWWEHGCHGAHCPLLPLTEPQKKHGLKLWFFINSQKYSSQKLNPERQKRHKDYHRGQM